MTTPPKPDHEKRPFRFKLEGPFLRVSTVLLITPISPAFKGLKCSVFGRFRALQSRNIYGIITQEMKEQTLCRLAITSLTVSQTNRFLLPFGKRLPLILNEQRESIGKPTGARILFKTLRSTNTHWSWMRPGSWSDSPLIGICRRACWFMRSIWRVCPAETRHCPILENTPVSAL